MFILYFIRSLCVWVVWFFAVRVYERYFRAIVGKCSVCLKHLLSVFESTLCEFWPKRRCHHSDQLPREICLLQVFEHLRNWHVQIKFLNTITDSQMESFFFFGGGGGGGGWGPDKYGEKLRCANTKTSAAHKSSGLDMPRPWGYKTVFMLNSAGHEIFLLINLKLLL